MSSDPICSSGSRRLLRRELTYQQHDSRAWFYACSFLICIAIAALGGAVALAFADKHSAWVVISGFVILFILAACFYALSIRHDKFTKDAQRQA